jgi:hypothetical protein
MQILTPIDRKLVQILLSTCGNITKPSTELFAPIEVPTCKLLKLRFLELIHSFCDVMFGNKLSLLRKVQCFE